MAALAPGADRGIDSSGYRRNAYYHLAERSTYMRRPVVMVSSTYYDLRQVRADLRTFLDNQLGYQSLLSEFPAFPVDPDADTIENCRRRVEKDADVLVLIIGGRYGYIEPQTEKSITNIEYLTARAKGIPIMAFVDRQVLNLLPVWEKKSRC
jgi:hypothetical protein